MSSQGVATTAIYMAYNSTTGAYVTGDVGNHTLKLVKDGTEASPTNSSSEVDSTNAPGAYKLALTAAETQFGTVWIGGKSSTSNVIILPITLTFEILPTALSSNSNVKADTQSLAAQAKTDVFTAAWTTQLTESYAGLHTVPTAAQLGFELRMLLAEKSVSGTTLTGKKIDGSTTAETFTLNSSSAPTSITRSA